MQLEQLPAGPALQRILDFGRSQLEDASGASDPYKSGRWQLVRQRRQFDELVGVDMEDAHRPAPQALRSSPAASSAK
jgi:hypothetical protein